MQNIKFIKVKSDSGARSRGAAYGVEQLDLTKLKNIDFFEVISIETNLTAQGNLPYLKNHKTIYKTCQLIADNVTDILLQGDFPIVLSGDHSNAIGTIAGIKRTFPVDTLGIVWIDAHADIHSPYTTPSGNIHGMTIAASLNEDNKKEAIRQLDETTQTAWQALKNIGNIKPKITPNEIVYIGLRDYETPEINYINQQQIKSYTVADLRLLGIEKLAERVFNDLQHCHKIYISYDVDVIDKQEATGTGINLPNGLYFQETELLIQNLITNSKITCFEITEIDPTKETKTYGMLEHASSLLKNITPIIHNR